MITHARIERTHVLPHDITYVTFTVCQIEATLDPANPVSSVLATDRRQDVTCQDCRDVRVVGHPALTRGLAALEASDAATGDAVNHPNHYGGDTVYEVIKVIRAWGLGFALGNAVKYIGRAGRKDPSKTVEDLRKAVFYIEHEIKHLEGQ